MRVSRYEVSLLTAFAFCIVAGLSDWASAQSGNGTCCTPAHADNAPLAGDCQCNANDNCVEKNANSCSGNAWQKATAGNCGQMKPNANCNADGVTNIDVKQYALACSNDDFACLDPALCKCKATPTGMSDTSYSIANCTGDNC